MFAAPLNNETCLITNPEMALVEMVSQPAIKVEATITPDLLMTSAATALDVARPESKPVRKRKSWGQVLPEPTTNLPPRKRAKTADEKEQRRIERVKRNRLAAHNSRERKREEMEVLQLQNDALLSKIAQLETELASLRGGKPSSFDFASSTPSKPSASLKLMSSTVSAIADATLQTTPDLGNLSSPASDVFSQPCTPVPEAFTPPAEEVPFVDPTQQSAALLCDLQCRSTTRTSSSRSLAIFPAPTPSSSQPQWSPLMTLSLLQIYWLNLQLFLSNISTLSSTWTTTNPSSTFSQQALLLCAARTYLTTMRARLRTISTSSPTQARGPLTKAAATSLALSSSWCPMSSSMASMHSSREQRRLAARARRRRQRYQGSDARRSTSAWIAQREIKMACDSIGSRRSMVQSESLVKALQKLRARGNRR